MKNVMFWIFKFFTICVVPLDDEVDLLLYQNVLPLFIINLAYI